MNRLAILVLLPLTGLLVLWGCSDDSSDDVSGPGDNLTELTCVGCHTSREMLEAAIGGESGAKVEVAVKADG